MTGGYDDGYRTCHCFWGREPSSLVRLLVGRLPTLQGLTVLDVGCGEGKNAAFLAGCGARVRALDVSEHALRNAQRAWSESENVCWELADILSLQLPALSYDIIIAYGLLHCLTSEENIASVVEKLKAASKPDGFFLVCTFNDRSQNLVAHPLLNPCLMPHSFYTELFYDWDIVEATDSDLTETHPNNMIEHTHSLTRILARKPRNVS